MLHQTTTMDALHYYILKDNPELSMQAEGLLTVLKTTAGKVGRITEFIEVDVVVQSSPQNTIPELGIGGQYTNDSRRIDIYLDLNHEYLQANLAAELSRTFIHEYMHALREQYVSWEGGTLLDSLIAEGLAQSFEIEVESDLAPSIYSTALTDSELNDVWDAVQPILGQTGEGNDAWFFGSDELGIKRWSGYALGFKLVQDRIKQSGLKASQLYKVPSADFIKK